MPFLFHKVFDFAWLGRVMNIHFLLQGPSYYSISDMITAKSKMSFVHVFDFCFSMSVMLHKAAFKVIQWVTDFRSKCWERDLIKLINEWYA